MKRRALLAGLALGTVTVAVPAAARVLGPAGRATRQDRGPGDDPWRLVAPLTAGSYLGAGWSVEALAPVRQGAAALTLVHRCGDRALVHVCRRSGLPRGLAHTKKLDLLLMNGGDGQEPTAEGVGRAVKTVALRVARRERQDAAAAPGQLMSHAVRLQVFGAPEAIT